MAQPEVVVDGNGDDDDEVSDAELLAEIENEAVNVNDTLPINDTAKLNESDIGQDESFEGGAQLTQFQDNIITTGSEVSVLLMVLLLILFLIQLARKSYQYFTLQSKLTRVSNPLLDAKPIAAEHHNLINDEYGATSYAVYNTDFELRAVYQQKQKEGAPPSVLKDILLERMVKCLEKARVLQRDGVGIRKNWQMDLLPRDVWDDFTAAQRNMQAEFTDINQQNDYYQFNWGQPHGTSILSKGREKADHKAVITNKVLRQKMHIKHQQAMHHNQPPKQQRRQSSSSSNQAAPSAKQFGNGFTPGFFNNGNGANNPSDNKKLTKKEKRELNKQKKAMKNKSKANNPSQPLSMQNGIETQTQPRRRKGKRRFPTQ